MVVACRIPPGQRLLVVCEDFVHHIFLLLDTGDLSAISIRPDHAFGLESLHTGVSCLASGGRVLDDVTLEHLDLRGAIVNGLNERDI